MSSWTIFWVLYFVVGLAAEIVALTRSTPGATLSEQVWSAISIPGYGKFIAWMLSAFLIWAIVHFISKGKFA